MGRSTNKSGDKSRALQTLRDGPRCPASGSLTVNGPPARSLNAELGFLMGFGSAIRGEEYSSFECIWPDIGLIFQLGPRYVRTG